jgi:LDH2 family malate/lactate/ureidoglycolate dehydrogenase
LLAAKKAKEHGMAIVGVNNCWFSGRNAYYLEQIARQGLVAIHTASGLDNVVPPGAKRAVLGTNPIGFAIPTSGDPLIFDIGTASTMWGEVLLHAMLDQPFPPGIGVDAEGRPTTSAREMLKGGVLPFSGHKGYGLSLVVQALGVLAGAKRASGKVIDSGFLFIVVDPELLMPRAEFFEQMSEMLGLVRNLPRQPGVEAIRVPSERAFAERGRRLEAGLTLPVKVEQALRRLAGASAVAH